MKKQLLPLVVLISSLFIFPQQKQIDSLENVLSEINTDSLYTQKLETITQTYRRGNSKVYLYFTKKYLNHAKRIEDKSLTAYALREFGVYYTNTRKLDSARYYCEQALKLFTEINEDYGSVITKNSLAIIHQNSGDYKVAIDYYKAVIAYLETKGPRMKRNILRTKMNIGSLYDEMSELDKANHFYLDVYNDSITKTNKFMRSSICINLSILKRKQKQFKDAIAYGLEAEQIETRPRSKANLYKSLASVYSKINDTIRSLDYSIKELQIRKQLHDTLGYITGNHNVAYTYFNAGNYNKAETYFLDAHAYLKEKGELRDKKFSFKGLSDVYYAKKEYKKAIEYTKAYMRLNDSLIGIEKQKAIADIEVKYETEKIKRQKETAEKNAQISALQNNKNKNRFIGSSIIAGLILLSSIFYFGRAKAKKKAELIRLELKETQKRLAIEKQYRQSELKALKAQMDPHFIFNALNSIQEYIILNEKNLASNYLSKFAGLMRNYLHHSDKGAISIQDEVDCLNTYLELEKVRFEDTLNYSIKVSEAIEKDTIYIPTMIIQPYVENALKHGLLHKKTNRNLSVSISKKDNNILCLVEDNGVGRKRSQDIQSNRQKSHQSFATKATQSRLELLNFGKDQKIGIETIDLYDTNKNAKGTKVIITIPFTKNVII